jgi:hypothetical protein
MFVSEDQKLRAQNYSRRFLQLSARARHADIAVLFLLSLPRALIISSVSGSCTSPGLRRPAVVRGRCI